MRIKGKKKEKKTMELRKYIPTTRQIGQKYKIAREMASTCTKKERQQETN